MTAPLDLAHLRALLAPTCSECDKPATHLRGNGTGPERVCSAHLDAFVASGRGGWYTPVACGRDRCRAIAGAIPALLAAAATPPADEPGALAGLTAEEREHVDALSEWIGNDVLGAPIDAIVETRDAVVRLDRALLAEWRALAAGTVKP